MKQMDINNNQMKINSFENFREKQN
jgi:hypothetical protein